ncbi:MAG TPA: AMP-binding protein, partial [Jatrophihabitans sp.]
MRPVALPPAEPIDERTRHERLTALLAAEYVHPDWGLPALEAPETPLAVRPAAGFGSVLSSCSEQLGRAGDTVILAALAMVLGRYGGVDRVVLALQAPGAAAAGPALCALDVGLDTTVADLLDAAADQLSRPWPRYDEELSRTLAATEGGGRVFVEACFEPARRATGDVALTVAVQRTGGYARADVTFRRSVVSGVMAAQFTRQLAGTVQRLADCPAESPLSAVELMDPIEVEQVLRLGESGRRVPHESRRLDELVAARAAEAPDAVAVGNAADGLSYRQLDAAANRIARALRARGVGAADLVAVCLPRTGELIPVLLGILRAGAAYVPMEQDYPDERLGYMLDNARPVVLVTDRAG